MTDKKKNAAVPVEDKRNANENCDLVNELLNETRELFGDDRAKKLSERTVGNNGYNLGQTFTFTGKIENQKTKDADGNVTAIYPALETTDGVWLSVGSLMGISSLKGYLKDGEQGTHEWLDEDGEKQVKTLQNEVVDHFDFSKVFNPPTRHLLTFVNMLAKGEYPIAGKKVTYLGQVHRQFTAKKDGESFNESWEKGFARCASVRLWAIK